MMFYVDKAFIHPPLNHFLLKLLIVLKSDGKLLLTKFPSYTANALGTEMDSWKCSSTLCRIPPQADVNFHITAIYNHIAKLEPLEA